MSGVGGFGDGVDHLFGEAGLEGDVDGGDDDPTRYCLRAGQGARRTMWAASGSNQKLNSWRGVSANSGSVVWGLRLPPMMTMPWVRLGEFRIDGDGEGDVGERAAGDDGDLVGVGVDLADEEVDGVFVEMAWVCGGAFGQGGDFVGAVGLLVDDGLAGRWGSFRDGRLGARLVGPPPQAPSQSTLPTSGASRRVSCWVRTRGKTAPMATGTSVRWMSSSMRRVCGVSSSRQALPVTMVMPRTWTCGDWSRTIMAI